MHSNIVNDNGFLNPNTNDIVNGIGKNTYDTAKKAELIAYQLVDKFGQPGNFQFYCLVAYKLSEARIWSNYEQAQKGRQPARLFTFLCNKDMRRS